MGVRPANRLDRVTVDTGHIQIPFHASAKAQDVYSTANSTKNISPIDPKITRLKKEFQTLVNVAGDRSKPYEVRKGAIDRLAYLHEFADRRAVSVLAGILKNERKNKAGMLRWSAARALKAFGPKARSAIPQLEFIVRIRKKEYYYVVRDAILALGMIGRLPPSSAKLILAALKSKRVNVREAAALAIGLKERVGPGDAKALTGVLNNEKWPQVKEAIALSLTRFGYQNLELPVKEKVERILRRCMPCVMTNVVQLLGYLPYHKKDLNSALKEMAKKDPRPWMRKAAKAALEDMAGHQKVKDRWITPAE